MKKLFTSEAVRRGHPDKLSDQISDNILDAYLSGDKNSRVAIEVMAHKEGILVSGEVTSKTNVDIKKIVLNTLNEIGYNDDKLLYNYKDLKVDVYLNKQSPDISQGVNKEELGAGDQGMMFGFATDETPEYMPLTLVLANKIVKRIDDLFYNKTLDYLRPDGKCQITLLYDDDKVISVDTIVVSVQTDEIDLEIIKKDLQELVINRVIPNNLLDQNTKVLINPTGKFVLGGPVADTGLTGRKIIVDTYGSHARHGGGAFSGKDYTKVDRSAAYYARYVCKNLVASGIIKKIELQVSYAIGYNKPISIYINTFNTSKISEENILKLISKYFDFSPSNIIKELDLKNTIYKDTTCYSHFGKPNLPWEKLDKVNILKEELNLFLN
ncbi:MAG: methionine adenosyltransferase [Bacilli bacterium]|nr:methionine adenosyltransferase [Bacilli bacterium]